MSKNIKTSNIVLEYLNNIFEQKITEGDTLICSVCGRKVKVYVKGKGPLICCGKEMRIT